MNIKEHNSRNLFIAGSLIGLCVFLFIFTPSTLNVTNDTFFTSGYIEKDVAQHYAGWMLYSQSDWQFPIGVGENMAYPYGSSVSYTDSVPIAAIFFKLFMPILPQTFQYFGIYVCLCYALMGGFSALLMNLFSKSFVFSCFSSAVFSLSPIMMERAFRHVALTSHFIIVATLYYYFKNKGNWRHKNTLPFIIINTLAISVHPYFLPFTFAISFAFFLEWAFCERKIIKPSIFIIVSLISTLLVGYIIGAFHSIGSASDIGYGLFNLNFNSYINPISNKIGDWSNFMPPRAFYIVYQQEAFNYLGFGIIVALCASLPFILLVKNIRREVFSYLKSSVGLIIVTVILTIFALSNTVTLDQNLLFHIELPPAILSLASIFRASGRFGWLLHYLIYIIVLFTISKATFKHIYAFLMVALIAIQVYDIMPAISLKHGYFSGNGYIGDGHTMTYGLTDSFWQTATDDFTHIAALDVDLQIYAGAIDIAILSGKANNDIKVNLSFEARAENDNRAQFVSDTKLNLQNGIIDENTLYVIADITDYTKFAHSGDYQIFKVDGQYLLMKQRYSEVDVLKFDESDTFEAVY